MFPLTRVPFWYRFFEPQPYCPKPRACRSGVVELGSKNPFGDKKVLMSLLKWSYVFNVFRIRSKRDIFLGLDMFGCRNVPHPPHRFTNIPKANSMLLGGGIVDAKPCAGSTTTANQGSWCCWYLRRNSSTQTRRHKVACEFVDFSRAPFPEDQKEHHVVGQKPHPKRIWK